MIKQRNVGIDLATAIALFGRVVVNFKITMKATDGSEWLLTIAHGFKPMFYFRAVFFGSV